MVFQNYAEAFRWISSEMAPPEDQLTMLPVTKRSGKSCIVVRRQACHDRLANAVYHWARVAIQHDPRSRAKYAELRKPRS